VIRTLARVSASCFYITHGLHGNFRFLSARTCTSPHTLVNISATNTARPLHVQHAPQGGLHASLGPRVTHHHAARPHELPRAVRDRHVLVKGFRVRVAQRWPYLRPCRRIDGKLRLLPRHLRLGRENAVARGQKTWGRVSLALRSHATTAPGASVVEAPTPKGQCGGTTRRASGALVAVSWLQN
jgi:hypothetical protein